MREVVEVPIDKVDLLYKREMVDEEKLRELAESMKSAGLVQIPIARFDEKTGRYQIVVGTRRYLAAKELGLEKLPVQLEDLDDLKARVLNLVENLHREDLSDMEVAKRLKELKELGKFSNMELARLLGKSESWVKDHLRMIEPITEGVRRACEDLKPTAVSVARATEMVMGKMTKEHAKVLLKQEEPVRSQLFKEVVKEVVEKGTMPSARALERRAEELKKELAKPEEATVEVVQAPRPTPPSAEAELKAEEAEEEPKVIYSRVVRGAEDIHRAFDELKQVLEGGVATAAPTVAPAVAKVAEARATAPPSALVEKEALERTAVVAERPAPSAEEAVSAINDLLLQLNDLLERLRLSATSLVGKRVRLVFEHPYEEGEEEEAVGPLSRADRRAVYVETSLGGGARAERMVRWYELKKMELA
jgi:ParB family chromosome partitioning protein